MKYLLCSLIFISGSVFSRDQDLPPVDTLASRFEKNNYAHSQALAPPVCIIRRIEVEDSEENRHVFEVSHFAKGNMIHEIKADKKWEDPLIIKINKITYLIWNEGKITIRKIEDGGEALFDAFFNITPPGPPPPPGDTNDWHDDRDDPRWRWKP